MDDARSMGSQEVVGMTRAGAPHDWPTFWDDYDAGRWEPETRMVLQRFLGPGSLFVDIGAWSGPVTLWATSLGARVVAYEPDAAAFEALLINTAGLPVRCFYMAVSDHLGWASIANDHPGDSQSRLAASGLKVATIDVETARLQWGASRPDLIKLDVEGHETRVLPTLLPICRADKIPIYLSWHEPWWPEPVSLADRHAWFDGFQIEPIRGDGWSGFSEALAIPG